MNVFKCIRDNKIFRTYQEVEDHAYIEHTKEMQVVTNPITIRKKY